MKLNRRMAAALCSVAMMVILIFDSKTALTGVAEGIELCLKVVIPSLFPFLILSAVLTESTLGMELRCLRPLCRLCRIPNGAAPLLLVGLVGGYPVGAQCITRAWRNEQLSTHDARRMLGFCNNAGPAFIFGMTAGLFDSPIVPWVLWMIQIIAVIMTGNLLPGGSSATMGRRAKNTPTPGAALQQAVSAIASISGWVIVFRIVIVFCDKWFLCFFPTTIQYLMGGILELTNGCCRIMHLDSVQIRFLLFSLFLSFGGLGVYMQTVSVTQGLGTGAYLLGKLMQTSIAAILASVICPLLFSWDQPHFLVPVLPAMAMMIILAKIFQIKKNNSSKMVSQSV